MSTALAQRSGFLKAALGDQAVVTDPAVVRTYEFAGVTAYRAVPGVRLLPANAGELQQCVRACRRYDAPFVARGSGTGLSGGAMPSTEGALIVTAKLNRIL